MVIALVITLLIAGIIVGLALSQVDLLNYFTSQAEANRMNLETQHQAQRWEIDLEYYRRERAAQAAARQEQYRQDIEHNRERHALEMTLVTVREVALLTAGLLVLLTVGGGLAYYVVSLGRAARSRKADPWQDASLRAYARRLAQANERLERRLELSQETVPEEPGSNGRGREREAACGY
jgi:hypothetical protein